MHHPIENLRQKGVVRLSGGSGGESGSGSGGESGSGSGSGGESGSGSGSSSAAAFHRFQLPTKGNQNHNQNAFD